MVAVEWYKAQLVAKGYTLTYVIDYIGTFALVAKLYVVWVFLSIAANLDWLLQQLVIKNVFLKGKLEEEVYMIIPLGYCKVNERNKVCKLKKSLYGLKQLPRAWFNKFAQMLNKLGYQQRKSNHNMFFRQLDDGTKTILIAYVDVIILIRDNIVEMENFRRI